MVILKTNFKKSLIFEILTILFIIFKDYKYNCNLNASIFRILKHKILFISFKYHNFINLK